MSNASRKAAAIGETVNLVSVDVQKLMDLIIYFNGTWLAPIRIIICFVFLWQVKYDSIYQPLSILNMKGKRRFQNSTYWLELHDIAIFFLAV